ncbi:2TM domain-containing protein [Caenimonas sedimenti]|uniref:2TM domain-containing protein n=1 Tax=Caenimonas sedimenti TaxID=2596921 RepID=A0A562ZLR2_9BURK|nr:2TM domain-containing protein [Caenimonas sedimenti]TWO69519.1 2TM domain-containing protein [Caenimonas sedimenti]
MNNATLANAELERQARRRASAKLGWIIHALVFVAVNIMMAILSSMSDRNWAIFPFFGWGIGLAIHGFVVFAITGGGGLHERLLRHERQQLQRDPW